MTTIRDQIEAWERTNLSGATVMTKNTEAYNHMQAAIAELKAAPWASLVLGADMDIPHGDQPLAAPSGAFTGTQSST